MSKHHFTSRTKARKRAADVVFEADQRGMGRDPQVLFDLLRERKVLTAALTPLPEYSVQIIDGVARHLRRIDGLISTHAKVSGLDRIPAVDLAVLRVAVWEMLENSQDVPPLVAIDEAISIVKSISTDASPGFVNAVLDAVRREVDIPAWHRERVLEGTEQGSAAPSEPEPSSGPTDISDPEPVGQTEPAERAESLEQAEPAEQAEPLEQTEPAEQAEPAAGTVAQAPQGDAVATGEAPSELLERESAGEGTPDAEPDLPREDVPGGEAQTLKALRDGHPTLDDLTQADLDELDELLDEY